MCGLSGIFGLEKVDSPRQVVQKMNQAILHRGPDAGGEYVNDFVALGHRRLSIIDLSDEANQPFHSADQRFSLVFNGEIYNFREIKSALSDYPFRTHSDTEVVLAAWMKWGTSAIDRFNGMFAFAVWDNHLKELFLVRDRLGIKPLYYARSGSAVVFASELRALLASDLVPRKISQPALIDYLRYQTVHCPETIVDGVEMLPPGHFLKLTDNDFQLVQYWSLTSKADQRTMSAEVARERTAQLLEASVKKRLVADVPFGAFLSGGIDSSLIVALMARNSSHRVKTFSVVFDEGEYSEAPYSRQIAERFNTEHTEIHVTPGEFLSEMPEALAAMDHPGGDGPNTYVVSKVTRQAGVTMALSGTGSDELFAGYEVFKRLSSVQDKRWLLSFPSFMRKAAGKLFEWKQPGLASWKKAQVLSADYFDLEYLYWVSRLMLNDSRIKNLTGRSILPANRVFSIVNEYVGYGKPGFRMPFLSQISVAEITTYLQNVLLRDTDQMSMAHALEVRVPFLDHELVEHVLTIPDSLKYPHTPKQLLTGSFPGLLPDEIIHRPKMGFSFPWDYWLKNELREFTADHLSDLGKNPLFNHFAINSLWSDFEQGKNGINWSRIWYLVVLQHWLHQNKVND